MVETLKHWPTTGKRSPKDPYPWCDWFAGKIVKLRQGRDYQTGTRSFRACVRAAAKRLGCVVKTTVTDGGRSVVVQALTKEKA